MMFRKIARKRVLYAFTSILQLQENPHDKVIVDPNQVYKPHSELTGTERLKKLFEPHAADTLHPTLVSVMQTSFATLLIGGTIGGILECRNTFIQFIENNQATKFLNHLDAKRKLVDKMFLGFFKGFMFLGIRIGFFASSFIIGQTLLSVYYYKQSIWHYTLGGIYAGTIYKFPLGPKGMVSGALFGGFFGSIFGVCKTLLYKIFNVTEEALIQKKYELKLSRDRAIHETHKTQQLKRAEKHIHDNALARE